MKSLLGWFPLVQGRVCLLTPSLAFLWTIFLLLGTGPATAVPGTSTEPSPTVSFSTPGVKQVTLQVCNGAGCNSITQNVVVLDPAPHILGVSAPAVVGTTHGATFQAQATGRPALTYRWTFTRGGLDTVLTGNPLHWSPLLNDIGIYQGQLEIQNAEGTATSSPFTVSVLRQTFGDVPPSSPFWRFVEAIFGRGVTSGCSLLPALYCPAEIVTREQMAVFLLLAKEGPGYIPPACTEPRFSDVPCNHPFARWINELAARGVTTGCGGGFYCPGQAVTRQEMSVFLLAAREAAGYAPPACTAPRFNDVPCSSPFSAWINELAARGITGGCDVNLYCPTAPVTRGQMAIFLTTTFGLPFL